VSAGVVTLSGEVSTARLRRDIGDDRSRVEGVVYVQTASTTTVNIAARVHFDRRFKEMSANAMQALPVALLLLALLSSVFALIGTLGRETMTAGCEAIGCRSWPPIWVKTYRPSTG